MNSSVLLAVDVAPGGPPGNAETAARLARELGPLIVLGPGRATAGIPGDQVARLADDLPEVAGLGLSPVLDGPEGACAAGARLRVAEHTDPFLRRLR